MDRPLKLREEMKTSYLIQRLEKGSGGSPNPFSFGGGLQNGGFSSEFMEVLTPILRFDYMGAAEFEFGAVPQAFAFLIEQSIDKNLTAGLVSVPANPKKPKGMTEAVYFIAPRPYVAEVSKRIKLFREDSNQIRTKENIGLKQYFDGNSWGRDEEKNIPQEHHLRICGWIELNNGFMFFTDKEMWRQMCGLLEVELMSTAP